MATAKKNTDDAVGVGLVNFNEKDTLKDRFHALNGVLDSIGARNKPKDKNGKRDDKITIELTRDDCVGLCLAQFEEFHEIVKPGSLLCNFGAFHEMAEFALNRPIWTHEFSSLGGLDKELKEYWDEIIRRNKHSSK